MIEALGLTWREATRSPAPTSCVLSRHATPTWPCPTNGATGRHGRSCFRLIYLRRRHRRHCLLAASAPRDRPETGLVGEDECDVLCVVRQAIVKDDLWMTVHVDRSETRCASDGRSFERWSLLYVAARARPIAFRDTRASTSGAPSTAAPNSAACASTSAGFGAIVQPSRRGRVNVVRIGALDAAYARHIDTISASVGIVEFCVRGVSLLKMLLPHVKPADPELARAERAIHALAWQIDLAVFMCARAEALGAVDAIRPIVDVDARAAEFLFSRRPAGQGRRAL